MSKPKLLQRAPAVIEGSQLPVESGAVYSKINEIFNGESIIIDRIDTREGVSVNVNDIYNVIQNPGNLLYSMTLPTSGWVYTGEGDNASYYSNKWQLDRYASIVESSSYFSPDDASTKAITATGYYLDSATSISMGIGDSYSAIATTYVYASKDFAVNMTVSTDDAGRLYVNGEKIVDIASCKVVNCTVNFKRGENKIQITYTEGSRGDGWQLLPSLPNITNIVTMSAKPIGYYSQTVTPTKLKTTQPDITENSLVQGFNPIKNDSLTINKNSDIKDLCNQLIIIPNANGSVTVYKNYDIFDTDVSGYLSIINK